MDILGLQSAIKQANDDMAKLATSIEGKTDVEAKSIIDYASASFGAQIRLSIDYAEAAGERLIANAITQLKAQLIAPLVK